MSSVIRGVVWGSRVLVLGLAGAPVAAQQTPTLTATIGGELNWSNNINQSVSELAQSEFSVNVSPALGINYRSGRVQASGTAGLTAYHYFGGTQPDTVYPNVALTGSLEAIEHFLFVDASVDASPQFINPFAPRSSGQVSDNTYSAYNYRVAPYIKGAFLGEASYELRSDSAWSSSGSGRGNNSALSSSYQWVVDGAVNRAPKPLGWGVQAQHTLLQQDVEPDYTNDNARLILSYLVGEDFSVSARGGYEQTQYGLLDTNNAIYGGGLSWRPTPRTNVDGYWERRYFGDGWQLTASHRMPFLYFNLGTSRDVTTTPDTLFTVPGGTNVFESLESLLTTRIPDASARAAAARQIMLQQGLPPQLAVPVPIYSQNVSLQTRYDAAVTLSGQRNSLAFNVYYLRTEAITGTGVNLPPALVLFENSVQRGAAITASHSLTPLTSINGSVLWQRTQGIGSRSDDLSRQLTYRIQLSRQLGPKFNAYTALRYETFNSNVTNDYNEIAALVGLTYAF